MSDDMRDDPIIDPLDAVPADDPDGENWFEDMTEKGGITGFGIAIGEPPDEPGGDPSAAPSDGTPTDPDGEDYPIERMNGKDGIKAIGIAIGSPPEPSVESERRGDGDPGEDGAK